MQKKARAQKVVAPDSDDEPFVAKKPAPVRPLSSASPGSTAYPLFRAQKKRKSAFIASSSDEDDDAPVASTSQRPTSPKKRKVTVEVVVPPLTPNQRRSLAAHKKAEAEGKLAKATPAASSTEGTPAAGGVSTVATSAVEEMDADEAAMWA